MNGTEASVELFNENVALTQCTACSNGSSLKSMLVFHTARWYLAYIHESIALFPISTSGHFLLFALFLKGRKEFVLVPLEKTAISTFRIRHAFPPCSS